MNLTDLITVKLTTFNELDKEFLKGYTEPPILKGKLYFYKYKNVNSYINWKVCFIRNVFTDIVYFSKDSSQRYSILTGWHINSPLIFLSELDSLAIENDFSEHCYLIFTEDNMNDNGYDLYNSLNLWEDHYCVQEKSKSFMVGYYPKGFKLAFVNRKWFIQQLKQPHIDYSYFQNVKTSYFPVIIRKGK